MPLASLLYNVVAILSNKQLCDYLVEWHHDLHNELLNDQHAYLGWKYPTLANNILAYFSDCKILCLYHNPLMSQSLRTSLNTSPWLIAQLTNMAKLAALFSHLFGWHKDILTQMSANVWEGLFICQLSQVSTSLLDKTMLTMLLVINYKYASWCRTWA
jgi:hypothetical protein